MKIKIWLVLSYLIVMLLPLLAGWGLYIFVLEFHKDQEVKDYFEKYQQLNDIRQVLENPDLYQVKADMSSVDAVGIRKQRSIFILKKVISFTRQVLLRAH